MMQRLRLSLLSAMFGLMALQPLQARTIDLAFMPPKIEPQDICTPDAQDDTVEGVTDDATLTDAQRLAFLTHDIRSLQASNPNRWFDFILTLIDWRAKLDPKFNEADVALAKIDLYVDANRLQQLTDEKLLETLRNSPLKLDNAQKVILANYYLLGIGVAADPDYAYSLLREAAFGGNPDALLTLARLDLEGHPVAGWDAPLDLTMTLALGGMLGQMNPQICDHAGRIAEKYLSGDMLTRNPDIALAWYKFAADLGGAKAAWRVVEFHLDADAAQKDNKEMLHYLQLAVQRGISVDANTATRIKAVGKVDEEELRKVLGYNYSADTGRSRASLSSYFKLAVKLDAQEVSTDSPYIAYLREVIQFDTAPGFMFTTLAAEVLGRKGQWAGEAEAMGFLTEAAKRLDGPGMQMLAERLIRYRDDPAKLTEAINLLTDVVARYGTTSAMDQLDTLYRCQANEAPLLHEADQWALNYRNADEAVVDISPNDLISLDPFKQPEKMAQIQTQALLGQPQSLANYVERVQLDSLATEDARRLWADRIDGSDKGLEAFARLEFALTTNPAERNLAVELTRRVYLNNGVTTALDLAVALADDLARSPESAEQILGLVDKAANRGEGAAIRLKSMLTAATTKPEDIFAEYQDAIEDRGDFLALLYAIPYVDKDKAEDYIDRAVSVMNCNTKDADELGEAYAFLQSPDLAFHWRQIGLTFENRNVLGKLGLENWQIESFNTGNAPTEEDVYKRDLAEGDEAAHRSLYALTSDPDLRTYDPKVAAEHLVALLRKGGSEDEDWVLGVFRKADADVRAEVEAQLDMRDLFQKAAQRGDVDAKVEYGLLLRDTAKTPANLQASAKWLKEAAEAGNVTGMAEYGYVLAYGIGVAPDMVGALNWLDQADQAGNLQARNLARLIRIGKSQ